MKVSPRRLAAVLAIALVAGGAAVGAIRYAGSSPDALPQGGSAFAQKKGKVLGYLHAPKTPRRKVGKPPVPLARGAAQLFAVGFPGSTADATFFTRLRRRDWGAVVLSRENGVGLVSQIRDVALGAGHLKPLVVAGPGVPGMPVRGPAGPKTARSRAAAAGTALRKQGISMALAPLADVGYSGGPYAAGAFSSDPATVARSARAAVDGWRSARVAAVAGSFPGTGAASGDPSETVATVGLSLEELRPRDMSVFRGLARRAPVVRMSAAVYAAFDGVTPATLLPEAVALLRRERFSGVVMSASLPATTLATGGSVAESAVAALRAGCDLLYVPGDAADQEAAYRAVVRAVKLGTVSSSRYREALTRVLALKRAYRTG